MTQKAKFVLEWHRRWSEAEGGPVQMAQLCRMFGVSRPTGYKWVQRYRDADYAVSAMTERSRRPKTSPSALAVEIEDGIVTMRKQRPTWGPRKLHRRLVDDNPGKPIPSPSMIAKVLKRRGFVQPQRRRRGRPALGVVAPFRDCLAPNATWCIDFKGWFLTGDGRRCYPLTLIDAFSRYLLRCEAVYDPDGIEVKRILDSAFLEFGLPVAIRSDGRPPFASTGPAKLTTMSVWLLQLGIRVEVIAPAKPQQNGRLERFHKTLKAETASPPRVNLPAQQRVFDTWRRDYNVERPHDALDGNRPARVYAVSPRRYPRPLIQPTAQPFGSVVRINKHGAITWNRRSVFISTALKHEYIDLTEVDRRFWNVQWGAIPLGRLDQANPGRGLIVPRRPRGTAKTTAMSLL